MSVFRRRHLALLLSATSCVFYACEGPADAVQKPETLSKRQSTVGVGPDDRSHEGVWAQYARDIHGFAGMYYDSDGDLVVLLQDTTVADAARSLLANRIGNSHRPKSLGSAGHAPRMRFAIAKLDYLQLLKVKDSVSRALGGNREVQSIGIDEKQNVLYVGVTSREGLAVAQDAIVNAGVAPSTVRVALEPRDVALSGDTIDLQYWNHPVVGGLRILTKGTFCSAGVPVVYTVGVGIQTAGLLTARHCLDTAGSRILMDSVPSPKDVGRVEFQGELPYLCNHNSTPCLHADAGLIQLQNAGLNFIQGGIANGINGAQAPTSYVASHYAFSPLLDYGDALKGPLMVDNEGTPADETVGQWVSKIGGTTGWTIGQITIAAMDRLSADGFYIVQTVVVNMGVYGGDSGAPVWFGEATTVNGNPGVIWDGIVWGAGGTASGSPLHYTVLLYSNAYNVRSVMSGYGYYLYTH